MCVQAVLDEIAMPEEIRAEPSVESGHVKVGDQALAGARVVIHSASSMGAWQQVVRHPEDQESWMPAEFGVTRIERLDSEHIFQQLDLSFLFGSIKVHRQAVIGLEWNASTPTHFASCWYIDRPDPFTARVASWVTDAPWQKVGMGGWDIVPMPEGGTRVSYQFWTEADLLPAVEAWAMSRTLPNLIRAFDAQAATISP